MGPGLHDLDRRRYKDVIQDLAARVCRWTASRHGLLLATRVLLLLLLLVLLIDITEGQEG
jgi:hypothetical protein